MKIEIHFTGSNHAWSVLREIRHRQEYILRGFAHHDSVERLYVSKLVARETLVRKLWTRIWRRESGKVVDVYFSHLLPERRWIPGAAQINKLLARLLLRMQIPPDNATPRIVWSYWPRGYRMADYLGLEDPRILDADHNIVDDANQTPEELKANRRTLHNCMANNRPVVAAARSMLQWLRKRGYSNYYFLRNGIDLSRFDQSSTEPAGLSDIPHPRIGYVGSLSKWIDYDLLRQLAELRQDWQFVILGSSRSTKKATTLEDFSNVHLLGRCEPSRVPAYLNALDIGIGLYKVEQPWLDVDSMKLYEYLAAGLPVVSTPFHAHVKSDFGHLIETAASAPDFAETIEALMLQETSETRAWDERRRSFLHGNTWTKRVNEAVQLCIKELTADRIADEKNKEPKQLHHAPSM